MSGLGTPKPALPDNPSMHLVIPFAASHSPECQAALKELKLPNLDKLLRQLPLACIDIGETRQGDKGGNQSSDTLGDEHSLSPPHERALAAAQGFGAPDGQLPWGAWHAAQAGLRGEMQGNLKVIAGEAWAVITPCHWAVQTNHITLTNPRALQLTDAESRDLLAAMRHYFAEDGIALFYDTPTRWLARGDVFAGLATASPYRVIGRPVDDWIPKAAAAKSLRRLQQEMQMLLYTHPLTEARADQGLLAVNSFWVSGTGALASLPAPETNAITVPNTLRDAAVREDWAGWAQAWAQVDAVKCAALLAALQTDGAATLTLCGERNARTYQTNRIGQIAQNYHNCGKNVPKTTLGAVWSQIMNVLRPQLANNILRLL